MSAHCQKPGNSNNLIAGKRQELWVGTGDVGSRPHFGASPALLGLVILAVLGSLALTGCASSKAAARAKANAELLKLTGFWQPQLMYLLSVPHARLYVEVDAVEGSSPSDETLDRLWNFLAGHCRKPGGIEVARSDVIPLKDALGVMPSALARKYLNGPPDNSADAANRSAFLYVLFYSDLQCARPVVFETGHPGARSAPRSRMGNRNPHVDMLPYPAMIYMNEHWPLKPFHEEALLHEAGHVLGLAFRATNANHGHCTSRPCLMTPSLDLLRFYLGLPQDMQTGLCTNCLAQLRECQEKEPSSNLRFVGPVLVRSEPGYHVLSLPQRTKVILGEVADQDVRDFAAAVRAENPSPGENESGWSANAVATEEVSSEPDKLREVIRRVIADPEPHVRLLAPRLWLICASRCEATGSYASAVEACRQAIAADPADHQSYNLLAWIKATCPDASIRDGKEAVSAARKACELTRWGQWSWIDTLAAAYAEAGEFKRAVRFQRQALRAAGPAEPESKEMRARLSSYEASLPYRSR